MLASLASRNLLRNRRRTAITVASIAIGLAAMTFLWAFIDGMNRQMVQNTTRYFAGDLQVHLRGYHDDPTPDRTLAPADTVLRAVGEHPAVQAAALRLSGKALASRGDKSRGIVLTGVALADEARVTVLFDALVDGGPLVENDPGVLVGEKLAEALRVRAGDELVLIGQAFDGALASARVPVRGVYRSRIDELDGFNVITTLATARAFFATPDGASAVAVRLRDPDDLDAVRGALAARLGERYEVLGWPRLLPMVVVSVRFHEVVSAVVLLVFFVVVSAAVANPVLMAVLERTREFGVLLALGMSRGRLVGLVLVESFLLGIAGIVLGNALGLAVTGWFAASGIDLGAFEAGLRTMPGLSDVIVPVVRLERSVMLSALVFAIACAMAVYPALKAAAIEPVEAMRGVHAGRDAGRPRRDSAGPSIPVFARIALRNLVRNPRRTVIMVAGTAFGIIGYVFILGFFDGFFDRTIENSTRYVTGHVQVERPGFRREMAPELAIADADALLARLRAHPHVVAAAPRVQAQGLLSTATKSEGVMLVGIEPQAEREVTFIDRTIVQGVAPATGRDREAWIGRTLAERLDVSVGGKVVVMVQAADGELGTAAYRVAGVYATESASFDGAFAFVTLPAAQALMNLDARISTINLRLDDRSHTESVVAGLREGFRMEGLAFAPWAELLPQLDEMVRFLRVVSTVLLGVLLLVVSTANMNTVFMSVTERTRELGVMMALGTSPGGIVRMIVYETLVQLLVALVIGYGVGAAAVLVLGRTGIDLSGFFGGYAAIPGLTGIVYPRWNGALMVPPGIALVLAGALVSLYPAVRAARLEPSVAIRHG